MKPKKSWKTTAAGIAGFVAVLAVAAKAALDSDPATIPQWDLVVAGAATLAGLLFARDNDVSSEDAGAK